MTAPARSRGPAMAFSAFADPTRRRIFEHLRGGAKPVGVIASAFPISRPAVSQHLKVLREAGLVASEAHGARQVYSIDPSGLGALRAWIDQFWDEALEGFAAEVEKTAPRQEDEQP